MKIAKGLNGFLSWLLLGLIVVLVVYLLMTVFGREVNLWLADYGEFVLLIVSLVLLGLLIACFVLSVINFYRYAKSKELNFLYKGLRYLLIWPVVLVIGYGVVVFFIDLAMRNDGGRGLSGGMTTCYMPMRIEDNDPVLINKATDIKLVELREKYKNNLPADVVEKINRG